MTLLVYNKQPGESPRCTLLPSPEQPDGKAHLAHERNQMMFTQTEDLDVFDDHHFIMVFIEDRISDDVFGYQLNRKTEAKSSKSQN